MTTSRVLRHAVPIGVVALAVAVVVGLAINALGFPIRKLDLHDSGIWVTNNAEGLYGRLNKSAAGLDAYLRPPGEGQNAYELDVLQDGAVVVSRDVALARIVQTDPVTAAHLPDQAVGTPPAAQLDLRGGTMAVLEPATGKIWATRYDPLAGTIDLRALDPESQPIAELGPLPQGIDQRTGASLAVTADGTVRAISLSGKTVTITPQEGAFAPAVIGVAPAGLKSVQMTSVGTEVVYLDLVAGTVHLPGDKLFQFSPDPTAKLQQPGPAADQVLVATRGQLQSVSLAEAKPTVVFGEGTGAPAAPVRLGACVFGAWAGRPGAVTLACNGQPGTRQHLDRSGILSRPIFRINRSALVLNDMTDGRVYDVELQRSLDAWKEIQPKTQAQDDNDKPNPNPVPPKDAKPKARDDDFGARPDRTTILYPLDNDSDTARSILSITRVSAVQGDARVEISPDGQTVRYYLARGGADGSFRYTISNGRQSAEATVRVKARTPDQNEAPHLRPGYKPRSYTVSSFGALSMPVAGDWRDADGDPVAVVAAQVGKQKIPVTSEGRIEFQAEGEPNEVVRTVSYDVSDGQSAEPAASTLRVKVLSTRSMTRVSPVTAPDATRGEVGKPITIMPLANDLPGSDPRNPQARLALGGKIEDQANLKIETDLKSGRILATATRPGVYFMQYAAAFGSADFARDRIRIDVAPAQDAVRPVAMPDQAVVRGDSSVLIDVLANDFDPAGQLLTVQAADSLDSDDLQVAIVSGRWLRLTPGGDRMKTNPQVVHYTITNGTGEPVTGDVTVTQLPPVDPDRPLVHDDVAVVRANDSVLIPVLLNDASQGGSQLTLLNKSDDDKLPVGQLEVIDIAKKGDEDQGDVGRAYIAGDQIRYVAPVRVEEEKQVKISYTALTPEGEQATGMVTVTINPEPSADQPDQAPAPQVLESRLVAGDTRRIPVNTSGQDPDGDSVVLAAIAKAPRLGRIKGWTANSITYEAYPTAGSSGTDEFSMLVTDRYGKTEELRVRVAVVPPGQTQVPVAVPDTVTARPGRPVKVSALSNDLFTAGDQVSVASLDRLNKPVPDGVKVTGPRGPVTVVAPGVDDPPVRVQYAVKGNAGTGPSSVITVVSEEGFLNAPRIYDQAAAPEGRVAKVDVLADAWDADGEHRDLKVTKTGPDPAITVQGGLITIPMTNQIQVIPYEVTDADGSTSAAVIHVPPIGEGVPYLKPGGLIEVPTDKSVTVSIGDYVVSPRGRPIKITDPDTFIASPAGNVTVEAITATSFKVTAHNGYVGPGAVTVEVMDGASVTDEDARLATVTIPVQVGPPTPVLRCPTDVQTLVAGAEGKSLDIMSLCHVWLPASMDAGSVRFTTSWKTAIGGVESTLAGQQLDLIARGSAVPGQEGVLQLGIEGGQTPSQDLRVKVLKAPLPRLRNQTINNVKAGTTVNVQLGLQSVLVDAVPTTISVQQVSGQQATVMFNGAQIRLTPGAKTSGQMVFSVTASDLADKTRTDRHVTGRITLNVFGPPDPPSAPRPGAKAQSHTETLTWTPGAANGARIDSFEITGNGRTWRTGSTSYRVKGLPNNVPISFRVRAHNKAGWSPWGPPSRSITPDEVPQAVTGLKASNPGDGTLTLSWRPAAVDGSPVRVYHVTWPGGTRDVSGTSTTITGLDNNNKYTFTVVAENKAGPGPSASATGQSAGAPKIGTPSLDPGPTTGSSTSVRISWPAANPNGPAPVTYTVTRNGGKVVCSSTRATRCTDDSIPFDGKSYSYTVTATNGAGKSAKATSGSWTATGTPANWGPWSAEATGHDGEVKLSYNVPDSRGKTTKVSLIGGPGGSLRTSSPTNKGGFTNGRETTVRLRVCNEAGRCTDSDPRPVNTYGPLSPPRITASVNGDQVTFTATGNGNGRTAKLSVDGPGGGPWTDSSPGGMTVQRTVTVGYGKTVTFKATLSDAPRNGPNNIDRGEKTDSVTVTTPKLDPVVSVHAGAKRNVSTCDSSRCHEIEVSTANFDSNVTCTITNTDLYGSGWRESWTQGGNESRHRTIWVYGGYRITVTCNGVAGTNSNWPS